MPKVESKVIGIVGSRRRNSNGDYRETLAAFERVYRKGDKVVSGGCEKGGDLFAELIARKFGTTITIHHADWDEYGKAAGPIRNTKIAEDCHILIAVVAEDRTGGTEDTVNKTLALGKPIIYV